VNSRFLVKKMKSNYDANLELKRLQCLSSVQTNYMTQILHKVSTKSRKIKKLNKEHAIENSEA